MQYNSLTGEIPPEIGNLTNLTLLYLVGDSLTGEIPPEIGNLTNLKILNFSANQLTGEIPSEIGNLINLETLWLNDNRLEGKIPSEIGNLINLEDLHVDNNQLTGEIPSEIGNLANLESLWLRSNRLEGTVPRTMLNMSNLASFNWNANVGLCLPADEEFQTWRDKIPFWDGPTCSTVSTEDQPELEGIQFYPNPTIDRITFTNLPYDANVELFDTLGRKVLITNKSVIDLSHLASGLYLYTVTSEISEPVKGKFIKQ